MNLIEIVKRLPWPDGAAVVVQDCTVDGGGLLKYCRTDNVASIRYFDEKRSKSWATSERTVDLVSSALADDHDDAIITSADWLEATMNTETQIPKPEMVSIPKQDFDALLAELEYLRKLQAEKQGK
jgi:hypothetical protein